MLLSHARKQRPNATQANRINAHLRRGERTIRFREKQRRTDWQGRGKRQEAAGPKRGRGGGGERLSTLSFFGCCTSCGALFLDLLVRGERLKKILSKRKEGRKG